LKLKLDLHTHCHEATKLVTPDAHVVEEIINQVKSRGLDGIAITDHEEMGGKRFAFKVVEIFERFFDKEIVIIPGQEIDRLYRGRFITSILHVVELYLPNGSTFRFIAHPGYPAGRWTDYLDDIHGLELENWSCRIDKEKVKEIARNDGLLLLSNSDAHCLENIGRYYNEIDLQELYSRAR